MIHKHPTPQPEPEVGKPATTSSLAPARPTPAEVIASWERDQASHADPQFVVDLTDPEQAIRRLLGDLPDESGDSAKYLIGLGFLAICAQLRSLRSNASGEKE